MKKLVKLFLAMFTMILLTSCANEVVKDTKKLFTDTSARYNNIVATFVTTQGEVYHS